MPDIGPAALLAARLDAAEAIALAASPDNRTMSSGTRNGSDLSGRLGGRKMSLRRIHPSRKRLPWM